MKKVVRTVTGFAAAIILMAAVVQAEGAKNVIFMISDGWGYNHILATNYWHTGEANVQSYESFPIYTAMATYMGYKEDGNDVFYGYDGAEARDNFDYIGENYTDSAAAVTAMSTGVKTYGGAIGVGMDYTSNMSITEYAQELGKATGNITSVEISHATPAGFGSHNVLRNNYKHIAQEILLDSKLTVVMGAGHPLYDDDSILLDEPNDRYVGGMSVYEGIRGGNTEIMVV